MGIGKKDGLPVIGIGGIHVAHHATDDEVLARRRTLVLGDALCRELAVEEEPQLLAIKHADMVVPYSRANRSVDIVVTFGDVRIRLAVGEIGDEIAAEVLASDAHFSGGRFGLHDPHTERQRTPNVQRSGAAAEDVVVYPVKLKGISFPELCPLGSHNSSVVPVTAEITNPVSGPLVQRVVSDQVFLVSINWFFHCLQH